MLEDKEYEERIAQGVENRRKCFLYECPLHKYSPGIAAYECAVCEANDPSPIPKPDLPRRAQIRRPYPTEIPAWLQSAAQGGIIHKHPDCWIITFPKDIEGGERLNNASMAACIEGGRGNGKEPKPKKWITPDEFYEKPKAERGALQQKYEVFLI